MLYKRHATETHHTIYHVSTIGVSELLFALFSQDLMQVRLNSYRAFHPSMDLSTQQKYYSFFPNLIEMSKEAKYKKTFPAIGYNYYMITNRLHLLHIYIIGYN